MSESTLGQIPQNLVNSLYGMGLAAARLPSMMLNSIGWIPRRVVAPAELAQIAIQMVDPEPVVAPDHTAFEEAERPFDGLVGHLASVP